LDNCIMASITLNKPSGGAMTITAEDGTSTETVTIPASGVGSAPPTIQTFTSSGTWTKPSGCKAVKVTVTGGGGGGGATTAGSGGGTAISFVDVASISSVSVTVGAAGSGSTTTGGTGGTSSFGSYASATGGGGGSPDTTSGAGPAGTGTGDISISGGYGMDAFFGAGGSSYWGEGGKGEATNSGVSRQGANPSAYGAGGREVTGTGTPTNGNGASGIVIVEEFY
jgi:hypothetical protein